MIDLINQITDQGAQIWLYGYFDAIRPSSVYASCPQVPILLERYRQLGAQRSDIIFVDAGQVVTPANPEFYEDEIHASLAGRRVIADHIANTVFGPAQ